MPRNATVSCATRLVTEPKELAITAWYPPLSLASTLAML
jgi:hypothetical protein